MMKYLMSILVVTLVAGCVDDNKKTNYALVELSDLYYTIAEKKIELGYTLPVESLYYSPGVDIQQGDDFVIIGIKRCNINDECTVDVSVEQSAVHVIELNLDRDYSPSQIFMNSKNESNSLSTLVAE